MLHQASEHNVLL